MDILKLKVHLYQYFFRCYYNILLLPVYQIIPLHNANYKDSNPLKHHLLLINLDEFGKYHLQGVKNENNQFFD